MTSFVIVTKPSIGKLYRFHRFWTKRFSFNNLNALLNGPPDLSPTEAVRALTRYSGGYCHELNSAFLSEMNSVGLSAKPVLATVRYGMSAGASVRSHLVLVTELQGRSYLSDTGFGCGAIWPLRLDRSGETQRQHCLNFMVTKIDDGYLVQLRQKAGWVDLYQFDLNQVSHSQIDEANHFSARSPESIFSSNLVTTTYHRGGRRVLVNTRYHDEATGKSEQIRSSIDLRSCLTHRFSIDLSMAEIRRAFAVAKSADRPNFS